jgi:hypothetical protein
MTGLHVLNGPRIPETVWHPFLCAHFHGTLMGRDCLSRQMARRKPNPIEKDQSDRVPPHLEYCASGACQQGAEVKAKFPDWKPEERTSPAPNWMSDILPRRPPPVEQLKREVADLVLSSKKPSWQEFKAERERQRAAEPELEPVETEPHPLSNRGLEGQMAEEGKKVCRESGCERPTKTKGLCGMHYQRARKAAKNGKATNGKPRAPKASPPRLDGQDEFDTMIRIRDDFRRLSPDGQRYVLAALKGTG